MELTSVKPKNITPTTNAVRLVGVIRDFDGIQGCIANFRGAYAIR